MQLGNSRNNFSTVESNWPSRLYDIMTARATRSLRTFDRNFAIFSKQTLHNSIMQPKLSKQDESEVTPELNSLIESGWKLDEEQIGVQKTYHFKTYTKVLVGVPTSCHGLANIHRIFITLSE